MDYNGFLELVKTRRSIRGFKPDPIPDDYVDKIIEAARFAPSGANSQPWEFIVIKDRETKDRIAVLVSEEGDYVRKAEMTRAEDLRMGSVTAPVREPAYKNAPVFILVCGDPRLKEAYPLLATLTRGDSNFVSSLANAFLYMTLAVTSLGLASQWLSTTHSPFVKPFLQQLLDLPNQMDIYDMLVVGYPTYQPAPRFVREHADMVHYGRFNRERYRTDEQIRQYIAFLRKG